MVSISAENHLRSNHVPTVLLNIYFTKNPMNKNIGIAVFALIFFIPNLGFTTERWREVSVNRWDAQSAKKIGASKVRFFYESPILDEQRRSLIKGGIIEESQANRLSTGRYGAIVDCSRNESGFFHIAWLNESGIPLVPPIDVAKEKLEMSTIAPETNMESLAKAVCKYFSIKY